MIPRVLKRLALALATPALLWLYSHLPWLFPVCWFALVPWLLLYTDDRAPRVPLAYHLLGALALQPLLYTAMFRFGWHFPVAFTLTFMVPWLVYAPLMRRLHHRLHLPRTLVFPLVWVSVEWLRARYSLAHFDLFRLGTTQARVTPLIQIADVLGVYGISFVVAAFNGWLADLWFSLREHGFSLRGWLARRVLVGGAAVVATIAVFMGYGFLELTGARYVAGPRLAVVQPNVRHLGSNAVAVHVAEVLMTQEKVPADAADLIVWPENAILDNLRRPGAYLQDLAWLSRQKGALFLVGSMGKPPDHPGRTTNAAFLVDAQGLVIGEYAKQVLFPWSEYIPLDDALGRLAPSLQELQRALVRRGWGFMPTGTPGNRMVVLGLPWQGGELPFGVLICVENTYPPIPAEAGRLGARFLVNITSEGEIGGPLQEHLLRTCMLRAVENRIAYVRAGNSGVSGFITPAGVLQSLLIGDRGGAIYDSGVLVDRIALSPGGPTIYARSHDAFVKLCMGVTLLLLLWTWVGRSRTAAALAVALAVPAAGCGGGLEIGDDPAAARESLRAGLEQLEQGRPGGALEQFALACADPVACRNALDFVERAFRMQRRPEAGVRFFTEVADTHPGLRAEALAHRGRLLVDSIRLVEAEADFRSAVEELPAGWIYAELGRVLMRLDRRSEAIEAFREGLEHVPDDDALRYLLGRALRIDGQYTAARGVLESLLIDDPRHAAGWTNLARVYLEQGEVETGRSALERVIGIDPSNVEARFQLFKLALRDENIPEAHRLALEIERVQAGAGRTGHRTEQD